MRTGGDWRGVPWAIRNQRLTGVSIRLVVHEEKGQPDGTILITQGRIKEISLTGTPGTKGARCRVSTDDAALPALRPLIEAWHARRREHEPPRIASQLATWAKLRDHYRAVAGGRLGGRPAA